MADDHTTSSRMSMAVHIGTEPGCLRVWASGEFSLQEARRTFLEILEAVARNAVKKVLFDGRQLLGEPTAIERFYYGEFVARAVYDFKARGVSPATMFAYVLRPPVLDPAKFGETVAVNRGMSVKATDSMREAREYLGLGPDPE
jgi:hypothetical protein